jgi:outer membrane protein assembly factor BamB
MLLITGVDRRRVLALGLAGLVPAALVTLLLVHQPSIGDRRLYPMLRVPFATTGLVLALVTLVVWATASDRFSRSSLSGLAWAGVTTILCVGPLLESTPRARLYALALESGDVVWATRRAGAAPVLVGDDLVVTDIGDRSFVGLDPANGRERWRHPVAAAGSVPGVDRAIAAGAFVPGRAGGAAAPSPGRASDGAGTSVVSGAVEDTATAAGGAWSVPFPGERVEVVARTPDSVYAYISTSSAGESAGGSIVKLDAEDGAMRWRRALPPELVAESGAPALGANGDAVVIAGGEKIGVLDAGDGDLRWTQNVVRLGKSRGYALPGAVQQVTVADDLVYLSTTPVG